MRLICLIAFTLGALLAQPAVVGSGASGSTVGTSLTLTYSPAAGNSLVVGIVDWVNNLGPFSPPPPPAIVSVVASNSAPLVADSSVTISWSDCSSDPQANLAAYYRYASVPAGITSVTITIASSAKLTASVMEVGGPVVPDGLDAAGASHGCFIVSPWNTGTFNTNNPNDLILGYVWRSSATGSVPTATPPYTIFATVSDAGNGQAAGMVYQGVTSAGAYQPSGSAGAPAPWVALGISYAVPTGAGSGMNGVIIHPQP